MTFKVAGEYIIHYRSNKKYRIDISLSDISLAAFGRKEIEIAEVRRSLCELVSTFRICSWLW